MSALFRQHVCCRHAPETNPLFTPPLPPLPPSIPPSIPSIFVLRTSRLPGCWREPQVNKKTGEGRERAVEGGWWMWGGDPDGATDVLAAAALLCRQTGSSELGLSALLPSPSLCSALLFSSLVASALLLFALFCSFEVTSAPSCSAQMICVSVHSLPLWPCCVSGEWGGTVRRKCHLSTGRCGFKTLFQQRSPLLRCPWGRGWNPPS